MSYHISERNNALDLVNLFHDSHCICFPKQMFEVKSRHDEPVNVKRVILWCVFVCIVIFSNVTKRNWRNVERTKPQKYSFIEITAAFNVNFGRVLQRTLKENIFLYENVFYRINKNFCTGIYLMKTLILYSTNYTHFLNRCLKLQLFFSQNPKKV